MINNFVDIARLNFLQFDHTSKCNLMCPQCGRVEKDKLNPRLPIKELDLPSYQRILKGINVKNLEYIQFNGNYGDPCAGSEFLNVVQYFAEQLGPRILVNTNGGVKRPDWWRELGIYIKKSNGFVTFSIDGIGSTNALYRRGSSWDKTMENVKAYLSSGARARWEFIVFEHNLHQVSDVEKLALEMGFESFRIKRTNRYINDTSIQKWEQKAKVENTAGVFGKSWNNIVDKYYGWNDLTNKSTIDCKYQRWGYGLFIDFTPRLYPCTWVGAAEYMNDNHTQRRQLMDIYKFYGNEFNNLENKTVAEVVDSDWFKESLVNSWNTSVDSLPPKLWVCARSCGSVVDYTNCDLKR